MKILLTGHRGRIGPEIHRRLEAEDHEVRGFDLADGDDILNAERLARAAEGVECVVHLAGLADDRGRPPAEVMSANLTGTANALIAAEQAGVRRFVNMSSGKALGMLERMPPYLPMDDNCPGLPTRPYGLAKWLAEEMCDAFGKRTGMETISLRAVAVFDEEGYEQMIASASKPPRAISGGAWHMGVHLDVRDVATATVAAVTASNITSERVLICASDIADRRPTKDVLKEYAPDIPWRGDDSAYEADPYRGLVDISHAERVLNWTPRHRWPGRAE